MRPLALLLVLSACNSEPAEPVDTGDPPVELVVPTVEKERMEAAAVEALSLALHLDPRAVWTDHTTALELASPGCPDFFAGTPDLDNGDIPDDPGWAWSDLCTGPGGRRYAGWSWWDNTLDVTGDASTAVGAEARGSRRLVGDGIVTVDGSTVLELDGEVSDSVQRTDATGYSAWSYNTVVDATLGGPGIDSLAPGGLRAELVRNTTGGDTTTLDLRGNVFFFEHRIDERYDSLSVNLSWGTPDSLGPDACTEEPAGWLGLRDENAFWYELVFQPRYTDSDNPYDDSAFNPCDGCAVLYVRGIEQPTRICPDLSALWEQLSAPEPSAFALDMRTLLMEP